MSEKKNKPTAIIAVKVVGPFTEWFLPTYREPYDDNEEYQEYFNEHIIDKIPVLGPSFGDCADDMSSSDLDCLADRMVDASDTDNWSEARRQFINEMKVSLKSEGVLSRKVTICGEEFTFYPFTRETLPPVNEESLKVYGKMADLVRERAEEIRR